MDAGVNILCYKSKTLANGAHPLMIRVCKDGKKKYVSLGVSVLPQFWDFTKNQPKKNCPNKAYIEKIIADKSSEFAERIIELKAEKKEGYVLLNPGSVSIPKEGNPPTYAIFEDGVFTIKDLAGNIVKSIEL